MTQYSTAQKLCLAGMVLGAILIGVGGLAPFWIITDPQGLGFWGDLAGKVVTANMGPFMYCVEALGQKECSLMPWDNSGGFNLKEATTDVSSSGWLLLVRIMTAVCVVVGGLCGLCSLCLACCTCCQRLIVLGLLAFGASGCGVFSAVVWYLRTDDFTTELLGFSIFSLGWAFFVFAVGAALIGLMSFVACFASPEDYNRVHNGMVIGPHQPPPTQLTIINPSAPPAHNSYATGASHPYSVPEGVTVVGPGPPGSKY